MFLLTLLHFNFNSYYSYLLASIIPFVTSICMQESSFFLTCLAHWVALLYEMGYTNKPALPNMREITFISYIYFMLLCFIWS